MGKKIWKWALVVFVVSGIGAVCLTRPIGIELDSAAVANLELEPESWQTEEAMRIYSTTNLPGELQQKYFEIVQSSKKDNVYFKYGRVFYKSLKIDKSHLVFVDDTKLFQKNGHCIAVTKNWRTIKRHDLDDDIVEIINIDIPNNKTQYIKIAEAYNFTVVYDTDSERYICLEYGKVLGKSWSSNLEALLYGDIDFKNGIISYNEKEYFIRLNISKDETTFNVVNASEWPSSCNVRSMYIENNEMKVVVIGK